MRITASLMENWKRERIISCSIDTPICTITAGIEADREEGGCVLLVKKRGRVRGLIWDFPALVEEHSYASSPVPIGELLKNAIMASFLVEGVKSPLERHESMSTNWIELRNTRGQPIALLSFDEALDAWMAFTRSNHSAAA